MYNQQPTQLDPSTQALYQALEVLKQRPPTKPDGRLNMVGQAMQAAQAQMQPQMQPQMPPQGQQQQGLPGIIANVQKANPSMQHNAQQGQVDHMAQRVSKHMEQQQQPPGLSGLPANNMGFAEGGIVPYAAGGEIDLSGLYGRGFSPESASMPPPENPEVAAIRARQAEIEALIRARPDFSAQQIAALDADKQARAEAAAAQQKRQGYEGFMAMLQGGAQSGMAGMGAANTQFNKGLTERKEASRQADLLDAQMRVKLGELDYARKIGDVTNAMGVEKDIAGIKRQLEQIGVQREGHGVQTRWQDITERTATADREAQAEQNKLLRASQERIAGMRGAGAGAGAGGVGAGRLDLAEYKALAEPLEKELLSLSGGLQRNHAPDVARAQKIFADLEFLRKVYGLPAGVGAPLGVASGAAPVPSSASGAPKAGKFLGFE